MLDRNHILGLAGARVLVVGDIMLDVYIDGIAERLSAEAPVPVLRRTGTRQSLGGAGNVVANLKALGAEVSIATACGPHYADDITGLLVDVPGLVVIEEGRDIVKTRVMAGGHQICRIDTESPRPLAPDAEAQIVAAIAHPTAPFDVILIADYAKGVVTRRVWQAAEHAYKPVLVDSKVPGRGWGGAAVIKPNLAEMAQAFGRPIIGDDMVAAAAREMVTRGQVGAVLVMRGAEGMTLVRANGSVHHIRGHATPVADVTGAGDTVLAVLGMAVARDLDLGEAASLANVAGGLVVAKPGTATVSLDELAAAYPVGRPAKIVTLEQAAAQAEAWKRADVCLGFTNGCFDVLHPGHLDLLIKAMQQANRLIVGLASDAHVRALKGDGRPVQSFAERAAALSALYMVDLIVECDLPATAIKALQPSIVFRGHDQSIADADREALGPRGEFVRLKELPGYSTTAQLKGRAA